MFTRTSPGHRDPSAVHPHSAKNSERNAIPGLPARSTNRFVITPRYDQNEITLCIVNDYTCTECIRDVGRFETGELEFRFLYDFEWFKKKLKCKTFIIIIIIVYSSKIVQYGVLHKRSKLLIKEIGESCKNEEIFERRGLRKL